MAAILVILLIVAYVALIAAFFQRLAPDLILLGSVLLSFLGPAYYFVSLREIHGGGRRRNLPYAVAGYLVVSIHLSLLVLLLTLVSSSGHPFARTQPGLTKLLLSLNRLLPDQQALAAIFPRLAESGSHRVYAAYQLASALLKSLVLFPVLLLVTGTPGTLRPGRSEPAFTQYFFYGAFRSVRDVIEELYDRVTFALRLGINGAGYLFRNPLVVFTWPLGIVAAAVLLAPTLTLIAVVACMVAFHALAAGYVAASIWFAAFFFGTLDRIAMLVRWGYAKCPHCYTRVPLPHFQCPECGQIHQRLIPGRYGLIQRRCQCDKASLPTLFALGKGTKLASSCPSCGRALSPGVFARNLHIPLVGGPASGKTSLLLVNLVEILEGRATPLQAELIDTQDKQDYQQIWKRSFTAGTEPSKTQALAPPALLLSIGLGRPGAATLYVYDPAGETFRSQAELEAHRHFQFAAGAILIIDPFSIPEVQQELAAKLQAEGTRVSESEPAVILERLLRVLVKMGVIQRERRSDLPVAVVVPKIDAAGLYARIGIGLEPGCSAPWGSGHPRGSAAVRDWLMRVEGSLVQNLEKQFRRIGYFGVSAFGSPPRPGTSFQPSHALDPILWLLRGQERSLRPVSRLPVRLAQVATVAVILAAVIAGPLLGGQALVRSLRSWHDEAGLVVPGTHQRPDRARPASPAPVRPSTERRNGTAFTVMYLSRDDVTLHSGPSFSAPVSGSLRPRGTKVRVGPIQNGWYPDMDPDAGGRHWIHRDNLSATPPLTPPPMPPSPVRLNTDPPGATVWVDGVRAGVTPCETSLAPGRHTARFVLEGYAEERTAFDARQPGPGVSVRLKPEFPLTISGAWSGEFDGKPLTLQLRGEPPSWSVSGSFSVQLESGRRQGSLAGRLDPSTRHMALSSPEAGLEFEGTLEEGTAHRISGTARHRASGLTYRWTVSR
jgi:hypothetical protein